MRDARWNWELRTVEIDNGYVCSANDQRLAHDQPESSSSACDHTASSWETISANFSLEDSRLLTLQAKGGQRPSEMEATATLHGRSMRLSDDADCDVTDDSILRAGKVLLLGVLDANSVISSRELALMLECSTLAGGRVLVVLVELFVRLLVLANWRGDQTARSWSGEEGSCGRVAGGGGSSSRDLPEQAGLEHCGGVCVCVYVRRSGQAEACQVDVRGERYM